VHVSLGSSISWRRGLGHLRKIGRSNLCRCPMVVAYRVGAVTALLLRLLRLGRLPYVALPNLLAQEALAPEFLQEAVQPEPGWPVGATQVSGAFAPECARPHSTVPRWKQARGPACR
jgi:hypothetical protein